MKRTILNIFFAVVSILLASCMEKDPFQINVVDKSSVVLANASDANMLFDDAASTQT